MNEESKKNQGNRHREQIGGCQTGQWEEEVGEMGKGSQKVQTASHEINNPWGCNVHSDHT